MLRFILLILALLPGTGLRAVDLGTAPVRVACVGDSITQGIGVANGRMQAYPSQLQRLLGEHWLVGNFGVMGHTLLRQGDQPYQTTAITGSLGFAPDVVVIMLGTNDAKPVNWTHKDAFIADYQTLIRRYRALPSQPRIFICRPPPVVGTGNLGIPPEPLMEQAGMLQVIAATEQVSLLDVHAAFAGHEDTLPDRIHPNAAGARLIAETVYQALTGTASPATMDPFLRTTWKSWKRVDADLALGETTGTFLLPAQPAPGRPWLWRFDNFPTDMGLAEGLLAAGWHVASVNAEHGRIARALVQLEHAWDLAQREFALGPKVVIEAHGLGSVPALAWAAAHPERIAGIVLDGALIDATALDPGRQPVDLLPRIREQRARAWKDLQDGRQTTDIADLRTATANPLRHLQALAKAGIPLLLVHGPGDLAYPPQDHALVAAAAYRQAGGQVQLLARGADDRLNFGLRDPAPLCAWAKERVR